MNSLLKENERIDDLQINNLKIIQNPDGFCFGIDSVLLSDFAKNMKKNAKVVDLGTGTGIISILLTAKASSQSIVGVEIQEKVYDMACRSVKLNNLEIYTKPANLQKRLGQVFTANQRDMKRAEVIKNIISET